MNTSTYSSVKIIIPLGGQTVEATSYSNTIEWTDASVENYRLGVYDANSSGQAVFKDAVIEIKDVTFDSLTTTMVTDLGKLSPNLPTKIALLSLHVGKVNFTDTTAVIPAQARVMYSIGSYSYSSTQSQETVLQRDNNYEQLICFNVTSKTFVARGVSSVQNDDYILFDIQNTSTNKNKTSLNPSLYTINGKVPFYDTYLVKDEQVLSAVEKLNVLSNLGIDNSLSTPTLNGKVDAIASATSVYAICGIDLIKGHKYKATLVANSAISAPSSFNLKLVNSTSDSTVLTVMQLGGQTFTEISTQFVWENASVTNYRLGFYGFGNISTPIKVYLSDITLDSIMEGDIAGSIVTRNRHKEAALVSVASYRGRAEFKVADKLTLLHFSDIHGNTSNLEDIVKFGDYYSYLLDDIIHTGDSVKNSYVNPNPFETVTGAENILNVIGNHEAWLSTSDTDYNATEKQTYDKIFAASIANWNVTQPADAATNGYCYYYKDYATAKFRLIVLDSIHWHTRNGVVETNPAQKAWFESVLADAKTNNLHVICAMHYPPINGMALVTGTGFTELGKSDGVILADTWAASDEIFGCVDSFISDGGSFAGWIVGHTHEDYFGSVYGHTSQPMVVIGTSGSLSEWNKFVSGTVAQDNFNVITFEYLNSKLLIKIIRIGQDTDVYARSKKTLTYNCTDGTIIYTT